MKIALIADSHFGARGDNKHLLDSMIKFYDEVFFPELKEQGVERIIHLGDLVDRRKYINIATLRTMQKEFVDRIEIPMDIICGNHDAYFKNTNDVNALDEIIGRDHDLINIYTDPADVVIDGVGFLYLPWITSENIAETNQAIEESDSLYVMGHLELTGFQMIKGLVCQHGFDPNLLKKFVHVFSGHFHMKSIQENIMYVGSPYEMNWSEAGEDHGFHIFNTEDRGIEHIINPYNNFVKIFYDANTTLENAPDVSGKWCKIVVLDKPDTFAFDAYCDHIQAQGPLALDVVEALTQDSKDVIVSEADDTGVILEKSIDLRMDIEEKQREKLRTLMRELYEDASAIIMEK